MLVITIAITMIRKHYVDPLLLLLILRLHLPSIISRNYTCLLLWLLFNNPLIIVIIVDTFVFLNTIIGSGSSSSSTTTTAAVDGQNPA